MTTSERRRLAAAAARHPEDAELAALAAPRRRTVKPVRKARLAARKESRMERNARTHALRVEVSRRAAGKCELCGNADDPRTPLEMHHLLPGRGRRTQQQALENCLMVCAMCHAVGHGRILYVGGNLLAWAARHGYSATAAVIRRRMDKALIADPTWPRDADETARLGPDSIPRDECRAPRAEGGERP